MTTKAKYQNKLSRLTSTICVAFFLTWSPFADAADYAVVVNANNNYSAAETEMQEFIKRLFLKQETKWPEGEVAKAFDRAVGSDERNTFIATVLGMDGAAIARHWLGLKQKTGETPPRNVGSIRMLLKSVEKYDGAFGIVDKAAAESLPAGVKVLFRF